MKWINLSAFSVMLAANVLAEIVPLGGMKTGEVSEKYTNLFTPAPFTFWIWALIYVMTAVFAIWQLTSKNAGNTVRRAGIWFALSCAFNTAWIFCWHYGQIGWSVICMAGLLASLIVLNIKLRDEHPLPSVRFAGRYGFEIYLGWIIAASVANVAVWLTKTNKDIFGLKDSTVTMFVLLFVLLISVLTVVYGRSKAAGMTVMWALTGILVRHVSPEYFGGEYKYVIVTLVSALIVIAVCVATETVTDLWRNGFGVAVGKLMYKDELTEEYDEYSKA